MHRIFLGLALWGSIFLITEAGFGIAHHFHAAGIAHAVHFSLGVFIAVYLCLVHTAVMFHFIGSGREMKEAINLLGGEPSLLKELRRFKMQVSPLATFAMLLTIATEVVGGGVDTKNIDYPIHLTLAVATILLNFYAFVVEYKILKRNLVLLQFLDKQLQERERASHDELTS